MHNLETSHQSRLSNQVRLHDDDITARPLFKRSPLANEPPLLTYKKIINKTKTDLFLPSDLLLKYPSLSMNIEEAAKRGVTITVYPVE